LDQNNNTYVGNWIQNLDTKEWTLYSYFNTKLINSYMNGALSQFQENFNVNYFGVERSFRIKNMYALDKEYKKWISLDTSKLYYDPPSLGYDTAGTHDIGYTYTYFYGSAGIPVEDQKAYDESNPTEIKGTIHQPPVPDFIEPALKKFSIDLSTTKLVVSWEIDSQTCPCYQYQIQVSFKASVIHTYTSYMPEETQYVYNSNFKGNYKIDFKCIAISNESVTRTIVKTI
jgi:hypothetical protein